MDWNGFYMLVCVCICVCTPHHTAPDTHNQPPTPQKQNTGRDPWGHHVRSKRWQRQPRPLLPWSLLRCPCRHASSSSFSSFPLIVLVRGDDDGAGGGGGGGRGGSGRGGGDRADLIFFKKLNHISRCLIQSVVGCPWMNLAFDLFCQQLRRRTGEF